MATEAPATATGRVLTWENCLNARDLGGYPTEDGGCTRWGAVARCANPARLTPAGCRAVLDYGVKTIIDLRKPDEVDDHPNPLRNVAGVRYVNISMVDPSVPRGEFTTLAHDYEETLEVFAPEVGRIFQQIAHANEGAILIHCVGGKDRTGLIAALLLRLAGVPATVVAEDYALSDRLLRPMNDEFLAQGPGTREEREAQLGRTRATAQVILDVLSAVDRKYGDVRGYLRQAGAGPDDIETTRDRLRIPPPTLDRD